MGKSEKPPLRKVPDFALGPRLVETIQEDLVRMGIVGEVDNSMLLYVVGTSRLQDSPGRVIVRGESSSGKSLMLQKVTSLFPPECIVEATGMTTMALYYMEPGSLVHKWLVMGERKRAADDNQADATMAIRQLISENRISRIVTVRGEGGFTTMRSEQDGPIAYSETTTAPSIFTEDLNRCLQVWADDSPRQTRRILDAIAEKYEMTGGDDREAIKETVKRHHEFQRMLRTMPVVIPYASRVSEEMPTDKPDARRAFQLVMTTIETVALLHQFQRKTEDARLVATSSDYEVARRLLLPCLGESFKVSKATANVLLKLEKKPAGSQFSASDVRKAVGSSHATQEKVLRELVGNRLVRLVKVARGRSPALYVMTGRTLDDCHILPPVRVLGK